MRSPHLEQLESPMSIAQFEWQSEQHRGQREEEHGQRKLLLPMHAKEKLWHLPDQGQREEELYDDGGQP